MPELAFQYTGVEVYAIYGSCRKDQVLYVYYIRSEVCLYLHTYLLLSKCDNAINYVVHVISRKRDFCIVIGNGWY